MPIVEQTYAWTLSSTGASTAVAGSFQTCRNVTISADCAAADSTAYFGLEHGRTSTGRFVRLGSTGYSISSGESVVIQLDGPLFYLRPYLISRTDSSVVVNLTLSAD